jgi:hypothetical protein
MEKAEGKKIVAVIAIIAVFVILIVRRREAA